MSFFISKFTYITLILLLIVSSCRKNDVTIMTVKGEIPASKMGITLPHEHVLFDPVMLDSLKTGRYNKDSVIGRITPFFDTLKTFKVQTFIDGTPEFMGRDPLLLAELSRKTGMNIITNTGWYAVDNNLHLPHEIKDLSAEEIAQIWIGETKNGIGNTRIKPGVINIGISGSNLSDNDKKLVSAACLTHLATGLSIMSYSGPAAGVLAQLVILKKYGVDPSAFIWLHAMEENSASLLLKVAERGVWISLDGVQADLNASIRISEMVKYLKLIRRLDHVLLSHDARGYMVGLSRGGTIRPYTELFGSFSLLLLSEGITKEELNMLMVDNPAKAFGIRVRKAK